MMSCKPLHASTCSSVPRRSALGLGPRESRQDKGIRVAAGGSSNGPVVQQLLLKVEGTERGVATSTLAKAEILALVDQLTASSASPLSNSGGSSRDVAASGGLSGRWRLLWTTEKVCAPTHIDAAAALQRHFLCSFLCP